MSFYDLDIEGRNKLVEKINQQILFDFESSSTKQIINYFSDEDSYVWQL
jgi:hypothetical protein